MLLCSENTVIGCSYAHGAKKYLAVQLNLDFIEQQSVFDEKEIIFAYHVDYC